MKTNVTPDLFAIAKKSVLLQTIKSVLQNTFLPMFARSSPLVFKGNFGQIVLLPSMKCIMKVSWETNSI